MKSKKTARSASLNTRLAAYSATAGAALLATPAANAAIQDITQFSINGGSSFSTTPISLYEPAKSAFGSSSFEGANQTGLVGLHGRLELSKSYNSGSAEINIRNGADLFNDNHVANLGKGAAITGNFGSLQGATALLEFGSPGDHFGNFAPAGPNQNRTGYIGFKSHIRGHTYYGWLHIRIQEEANGAIDGVSLVANSQGDFGAFDPASDVAPDNFTVGSVAAVPEPSSTALGGLGLLALGVAGIREHRRRKSLAAKN